MTTEKYQSFTIWKINPNEDDQFGDVPFISNSHGRIFCPCIMKVENDAICFINKSGEVEGVFSLHHYFAI